MELIVLAIIAGFFVALGSNIANLLSWINQTTEKENIILLHFYQLDNLTYVMIKLLQCHLFIFRHYLLFETDH